jgi:hypothetical protein
MAVFERSIIRDAVREMRAQPLGAAVQEQGCTALAYFATRSAEKRAKILVAGGVETVVMALRAHPTNRVVLEQGCRVLVAVAENDADQLVKMAAAGGVDAVVKGMEQCPKEAAVQEWCCHLLRLFAEGNMSNQVHIARAGGLDAVDAALNNHLAHSAIKLHGTKVVDHVREGAVMEQVPCGATMLNTTTPYWTRPEAKEPHFVTATK